MTCRRGATQNGRESVIMRRGEMLPTVESSQVESIWDVCIPDQDALHTDSVKLLISSLKPSKNLRERDPGSKSISVLVQLVLALEP